MKRRVWFALVLLVAQAAAVGVGAHVYAWYTNSLEGGGRWIASKRHLERRVMGSSAFADSHHTLSGQRLDLGRWFGFQEVLLAEPVAARTVAFDFRADPGGYLVFLHGIGPDGSAGLRLSTDTRFPSGRFTAAATGEFLEFEPLPALAVENGAWSHLALAFGPAGALATLDGGPPVRVGATAGPQRFGFRSGYYPVVVDDVRVELDGAGGFHESFFNAAGFRRGLLALAGLLVVDLAAWLLFRKRRLPDGRVVALALGGAATLLAMAVGVYLLRKAWAGRYPALDRHAEDAWLEQEIARITQRIETERGTVAELAPATELERVRVLVVGTSQTWGAGAAHADEGFVEVLEDLLAAADPGRRWECVNAGVSGLRAPRLLELFRDRWLALEPDVLVVNLSFNDKDPVAFAEALHGFARVAAEHRVAVLFALEPSSIEATPEELPLHAVMRAVGAERGVPVVDVHRALAQQYDRGLMWWDPVHPTSFGHRLIAETLLPAVRACVDAP